MYSQAHWTNVHANSKEDSFWKHEWEKHGTCAAQLPQMDTELKYFEEGVALNAKFPLQKYLSDASITPGTLSTSVPAMLPCSLLPKLARASGTLGKQFTKLTSGGILSRSILYNFKMH